MKRFRHAFACVAVPAALAACHPAADAPAPAASAPPANERDRASYMIGLDLARQLRPISSEIDLDRVIEALRTAHRGERPLLDEREVDAVRRDFTRHLREQREAALKALAAKNAAAGDAFLADNARKPNVRTTASGLQYEVIEEGRGAKPEPTDTVEVNYVGMLPDGRKFEDTYAVGHSMQFPLNRVMPGLAEALALMPVGAKYRVWIPGRLGYGERGKDDVVEPNALLAIEIELLAIAG